MTRRPLQPRLADSEAHTLHVKQANNQGKSKFQPVSRGETRLLCRPSRPVGGFLLHPEVCCSVRRAQAPLPGRRCPSPPYHVSVDDVVAMVQLGQVLEVVELAEHHFLLGKICGERERACQPGPVPLTPGPPPQARTMGKALCCPEAAESLGQSWRGERLITSTQTGQGPLAGRVGTRQECSRSPHTFSLPVLPPRSPHPWPEQKVPPHTRA